MEESSLKKQTTVLEISHFKLRPYVDNMREALRSSNLKLQFRRLDFSGNLRLVKKTNEEAQGIQKLTEGNARAIRKLTEENTRLIALLEEKETLLVKKGMPLVGDGSFGLVFQGNCLDEDRTVVGYYNIVGESTLYLVSRIVGEGNIKKGY